MTRHLTTRQISVFLSPPFSSRGLSLLLLLSHHFYNFYTLYDFQLSSLPSLYPLYYFLFFNHFFTERSTLDMGKLIKEVITKIQRQTITLIFPKQRSPINFYDTNIGFCSSFSVIIRYFCKFFLMIFDMITRM